MRLRYCHIEKNHGKVMLVLLALAGDDHRADDDGH